MEPFASGIFLRCKNTKFIDAVVNLSRDLNSDDLVKDGLFHRVIEQYAVAIGKKRSMSLPKSKDLRDQLQKELSSVDAYNSADRILICMDKSREFFDLILSKSPEPRVRKYPKRCSSPSKTVITETTELESVL